MANNYQDIGDNIPVERMAERWHKPEEFQNMPLILKSALFNRGKRGNFFVLTVEVEATEETVLISTGASQPVMVVQAWQENGSRPVRFMFQIEGQRVLIVRATPPQQTEIPF